MNIRYQVSECSRPQELGRLRHLVQGRDQTCATHLSTDPSALLPLFLASKPK